MELNDSLITRFRRNRELVDNTPDLDRVIGLKEAVKILDTSESTIRRGLASGDYSEEKGDYKKIGTTIIFSLEAILNRKYMDSKTYWTLKDEFDKEKLSQQLLGEDISNDVCNSSNRNSDCRNELCVEILDRVKEIKEMLKNNK